MDRYLISLWYININFSIFPYPSHSCFAAKVLFTNHYTWQNFKLQFLHLVNNKYTQRSYSQDVTILIKSFSMCNGRWIVLYKYVNIWICLLTPPVHLFLVFEISSLKNQVSWTRFLVYFKLDFYCRCCLQKSSSKLAKNPVCRTWFCKLDSWQIECDMDRGSAPLIYCQKIVGVR